MKIILEKQIIKMVDKAYNQIDKSLNKDSRNSLEYGVALGLDNLLDIKRLLEEKDNIYSGIISEFKGFVGGVEINKEWIYNSTDWLVSLLYGELNVIASEELIKEYIEGIENSYLKMEYFNLGELEEEISYIVEKRNFDFENSDFSKMKYFYQKLEEEI